MQILYKYVPQSLQENNNFKVYWKCSVLTDQQVPNNRPDLILIIKLINMMISNNNNLQNNYNEKIVKYRNLQTQIKIQWRTENVQIFMKDMPTLKAMGSEKMQRTPRELNPFDILDI